jgi:hypothetical protein
MSETEQKKVNWFTVIGASIGISLIYVGALSFAYRLLN